MPYFVFTLEMKSINFIYKSTSNQYIKFKFVSLLSLYEAATRCRGCALPRRSAMFVFRTLGKMLLGGAQAADLILLADGDVWKVQTRTSPKGKVITRTKLYSIPVDSHILTLGRDGKLTLVLRRETGEFNYVLYLRDYDENESEEARFKLDRSVDFRRALNEDGQSCFVWRDTRFGDNDRVDYQFIWPSSTPDATLRLFHSTVAQCLYETNNKRTLDGASEADIQALMVVEDGADEATSPKPGPSGVEGKVVYRSELAGFYIYDLSDRTFKPRAEPIYALLSSSKPYAFDLNIMLISDNSVVHKQPLSPDATLHADHASLSFIWCHVASDAVIWTYSLRFTATAGLLGFSSAIGQATYEIKMREAFSKVEEDDVKYVLNPFLEDVEMAGPSDEEEDVTESEDDDAEGNWISHGSKSEKNAQLAVGYKNDRSFVSRGTSIGVFKHTDDRLQLSTNIDKVRTTSGRLFTPSKMMLHEEDTALLLMNPDERNKIYKLDLERGAVVESWDVHEEAPVTDILPDSKYAQMTGNKTLIGINSNSLFRIDPRLPGTKRVDSQTKQYAVKYGFTRGATTGKGELALASEKGEIRLFDKLDKRAKTLLPGFGDAIIGIDVSENGKLIIATCKNYLLLINTEMEDGVQGFTKSMGKKKPAPKRLQLKPEHVAFMGSQVSFTPARFSTGSAEERSIITSTGPYVITWNLRRVKQGKLFDYQIKRYEDNVVADNFRFGQDRNIVVTLPDHVTMISKKSLSAPTPSAFSKSRNNVVDSPF